jgi:hypothetical protein
VGVVLMLLWGASLVLAPTPEQRAAQRRAEVQAILDAGKAVCAARLDIREERPATLVLIEEMDGCMRGWMRQHGVPLPQ